jgi:hypothetical protein
MAPSQVFKFFHNNGVGSGSILGLMFSRGKFPTDFFTTQSHQVQIKSQVARYKNV